MAQRNTQENLIYQFRLKIKEIPGLQIATRSAVLPAASDVGSTSRSQVQTRGCRHEKPRFKKHQTSKKKKKPVRDESFTRRHL